MSAPLERRAALRLGAAVLLFAATASVAVAVVSTRLRRPAQDTIIAPEAVTNGLAYAPGPGRTLLVDSSPSGANVSLGGALVGTTPWSSDWTCIEGEAVEIVVERGAKRHRTVAVCQGGTTRLRVKLEGR